MKYLANSKLHCFPIENYDSWKGVPELPSENCASSVLPHFTQIPDVLVEYIAKNQVTAFFFSFLVVHHVTVSHGKFEDQS